MMRRLTKGLLIAIEGIDGAGKTTQAIRLAELIGDLGLEVVRTKEPTDGKWGRKLRESATTGRLEAEAELDLFVRDRKEHVKTKLRPALERGAVVIVDRYYFSTAAYQGARGMNVQRLLELNEAFAPQPDLLLLLEVDPAVGVERIGGRGDVANHFEGEEYLRLVDARFKTIDRPYLVRIDGTQAAEDISLRVMDLLCKGPLSTVAGVPEVAADEGWPRVVPRPA